MLSANWAVNRGKGTRMLASSKSSMIREMGPMKYKKNGIDSFTANTSFPIGLDSIYVLTARCFKGVWSNCVLITDGNR